MRMSRWGAQEAPPPKNIALGSLQQKETTSEEDHRHIVRCPLVWTIDNEDLVSSVEKSVEGKSPKKANSNFKTLPLVACSVEGLEVTISDEVWMVW